MSKWFDLARATTPQVVDNSDNSDSSSREVGAIGANVTIVNVSGNRCFTLFRRVGHLPHDQVVKVIQRELSTAQWSPADWRAYFDERAGIVEHDGGLDRDEAEQRAFVACIARFLERWPPGYRPDLNCLHCGDMVIKAEASPIVCADRLQRWVHHVCMDDFRLLRVHDAVLCLARLGIVDPIQQTTVSE